MSTADDKRARDVAAALDRIPNISDADPLRRMISNARRANAPEVEEAARRRLLVVRANSEADDMPEGSLDHAMWQAICAIEEMKSDAAGKTIRLSYLRRDIDKMGVMAAMDKLVSKPGPSERFDELVAAGRTDLTAEAVVLAHRSAFSDAAVARSEQRLATVEAES